VLVCSSTGDLEGPFSTSAAVSLCTGAYTAAPSRAATQARPLLHAHTPLLPELIDLVQEYSATNSIAAAAEVWLVQPLPLPTDTPAVSGADIKSLPAPAPAASTASATAPEPGEAPSNSPPRPLCVPLAMYQPERGFIVQCADSATLAAATDRRVLLGLVGSHSCVNDHADLMAVSDPYVCPFRPSVCRHVT
jgi:hypothetical protein